MRQFSPLITAEEARALDALFEQGHRMDITAEMVEEWLRQHPPPPAAPNAAKAAKAEPPAEAPSEATNEAAAPRCRKGRPPVEPPWLQAAAKLVAHGYTLRKALRKLGVSLSQQEMKNVYRRVKFRHYCETFRRQWLQEWGPEVTPREVERLTAWAEKIVKGGI